MTKQEIVWARILADGEAAAVVDGQIEDMLKAQHYEMFFRQQILGRKSTFKPE